MSQIRRHLPYVLRNATNCFDHVVILLCENQSCSIFACIYIDISPLCTLCFIVSHYNHSWYCFGSIEPFFGWKNLSTILHRRIFVALLTLYMAISELIEHKLDKLFKKVIQINLLNVKVVALSIEGMLLLRVVHYLFILWCFHVFSFLEATVIYL